MHLHPHLGSAASTEDPGSVATAPLRSNPYPSLPTQPHLRPGMETDQHTQPPPRQTTFPPDRTSIADHAPSSAYHYQQQQQQQPHTPDHTQAHRHFQFDHSPMAPPSSSSTSQRDRQQYHIPPSFPHSHPYPTSLSEGQQLQQQQQQQQQQQLEQRHVQSMSSSHYKEHDQDQVNTFVQEPNYNYQNRQLPQTIDDRAAQQQQLQQQQKLLLPHRHHHHNTPLRDQHDDDSSRPNQAYSRHTHLSPVYSSYPTEHNQHLAIQRHEQYSQQLQQANQQQRQQQRRHTGPTPSHDHTQRLYYNLEQHKQQQLQQQKHTFNSQTQEGHGPGTSLHNASQQQHALGAIGRGQDFGSTMIAQLHPQQPYRHQQQQQLKPSQPHHHASSPSSSSPSHSANPSHSTSFSSSSSSAQFYPSRSSSAFASASTLSPSPGSSFQRHRARTLSSVSPYFSSPKPSSSYPSEAPITALDSDAYVSSSISRQPSSEWSPRRKRGRANQLEGFGSGQGGGGRGASGGHRGGNSSGSDQLIPQTTLHQRQSSQDTPMAMATAPIPATYSSSLPSDMWMGESLISQPAGGSSQSGGSPFRARPLERSEDRQWWSQREEPFESASSTGSVGSRSGSASGSGSGSGPSVASARQDGISALDIPKTYGPNKRPLILSPPAVGTDSFAPFDRSFAASPPESSFPQQHHQYRQQQQQQQQQQHRQFAQSQGGNQEAGIEAQEQRAAQQHQQVHGQNNSSNNNNDSTTAISTTPAREKLSESVPRTNPSFSSPRRTTQTLPMPHFRGQLVQPQSRDSSYQRRYYSSSQPSSRSSGSFAATAHATASAGMVSAAATSDPFSLPTGTTSSTLAGQQASSKSASPSPGASMRKSASSKRLLQLADNSSNPLGAGAPQDASGIVSLQLGRLLISTRQHVKSFLDSFICPRSQGTSKDDINAVHPNLERVLLDLLNGILQSHNAFAARDNISSQEQPTTFRPTLVRSLAHLQELLSPGTLSSSSSANISLNNNPPSIHGPPSSSSSSLLGSPSRSLSSSPSSPSSPLANRNSDDSATMDSTRRHRIPSRHPPSRLSTSTSYYSEATDTETDVNSDTELLESGVAGGRATRMNPDITLRSMRTTPAAFGNITPAAATTTPISIGGGPTAAVEGSGGHLPLPLDDLDGSMVAADLYRSTIEFLALMTAFVSVVCWLMQTRLLDTGLTTRNRSGQESSAAAAEAMEGIDMDHDGADSVHRDGRAQLSEFLTHFDDLDNVLNPIKEALSRVSSGPQQRGQYGDEQESDAGLDPMDSVGLFAWHYFLFASDQESPFEREAHAIDLPSLHSVHFDVILNELYTTHILSMTAKEHQKDHGQFYTPPGVVDFMWKRTVLDRGHLLGQFVESVPSYLSTSLSRVQQHDLQEPLIPTALDPCLGVSTFLSCYVRLLIQEAERDHTETIWRSEAACRLLLAQICTHVWGIELDGFAFWMARCGILVALMPLVQHVESFSHPPHNPYKDHHNSYTSQQYQQHYQHQYPQQYYQQQHQQKQQRQLPRLHLFRSDTLQLTVPDGTSPKTVWDRHCILQLRNPSRLQFDFIVTNPPYMIRKTGTFSAPDPEVYDWSILGASIATTAASASATVPEGSSPIPKAKSRSSANTKAVRPAFEDEEGRLTPTTVDTGDDDSGSEAPAPTMSTSGERSSKIGVGGTESVLQSSPRTKKTVTQVRPTGSKGMMQAYGYFVWFAAQRIKPGKGVVCMITASQWLTLEFAVKLRAWLFGNCLMDEFFQFEPYKVFSKVQTDSLIFKIRAIPPDFLPPTTTASSPLPPMSSSSSTPLPLPLGDHRTVFLRHTDHHKPLAGILQDYMTYSPGEDSRATQVTSSSAVGSAGNNNNNNNNNNTGNNNTDLNIMVSSKTREELAAVIMAPSATPNTNTTTTTTATAASVATSGKGEETTAPATYTYSFAPMMPASVLTTFMLALTQDLGAICSAGTKKMNRLRAVEPLLWHRGPNTNPVYGLVVRTEYARAMFGEEMTSRWFRPALYWNGKNSPEGPPTVAGGASAATMIPSKALHREGQFWQGRDRQRLSKKEGSPAESYCVPTSDPQRMYALCMVDKESVKVLRQQVEQKVEGSQALWNYLTDVRTHFQPGLASKRKVASSGKSQAVDDEGVAFCSTNQCGADVPEKIVHPINYGYFSKTQPRQRFFLDTDSLAVTNQCIYLTLNKLSSHYDAEQCPPLIYFLTLLNSTTLQFFVLHHCQYDQQGRMRLFRESMAKIPFQDRDVKNHPERIQYVAHLGSCMVELKDILYSVVTAWRLTGSHHGSGAPPLPPSSSSSGSAGSGRRGSIGGLASGGPFPAISGGVGSSTSGGGGGGSSNQGLLDWIRKGGNPPPGLLARVKEQVRRMLVAQANHHRHHNRNHQQQGQAPGSSGAPQPGMGGIPHATKPPMTSSSAPSSSSILHLNKRPRDCKTGALMSSGGGPFLTDTDTDTNTFTDTDTDTDDTMDPWVAFRRVASSNSPNAGSAVEYRYHQQQQLQQQSRGSKGQGQHSLARILNMPEDDEVDEEVSMDEDGGNLMTDNTQTMPMPIPEGSRDRRGLRPTVNSGFGHDEEFEEEEEQDKKPRSLPHTVASGTTSAMETYMDYQRPSTSSPAFNSSNTSAIIAKASSSFDHQISLDADRILQALERAVTMVEMIQWAVDQYGYMLYGIPPKFQKLLELELKIVYSARVESLVGPTTPPPSATGEGAAGVDGGEDVGGVHIRRRRGGGGGGGGGGATENLASSLGITVWDLYRWKGDSEPMPPLLNPTPASTSNAADPATRAGSSSSSNCAAEMEKGNDGRQALLPSYAFQILENAQSATQLLRELIVQFPALPFPSL